MWIQGLFICFIFSLPVTSFFPLFLPKFNILLVIVIPCSQKCLESSLQFPSDNGGCCGVGLSNCQVCIFPLELEEEKTDINKINTNEKKNSSWQIYRKYWKKNKFVIWYCKDILWSSATILWIFLQVVGWWGLSSSCEQPCGVCSWATT